MPPASGASEGSLHLAPQVPRCCHTLTPAASTPVCKGGTGGGTAELWEELPFPFATKIHTSGNEALYRTLKMLQVFISALAQHLRQPVQDGEHLRGH